MSMSSLPDPSSQKNHKNHKKYIIKHYITVMHSPLRSGGRTQLFRRATQWTLRWPLKQLELLPIQCLKYITYCHSEGHHNQTKSLQQPKSIATAPRLLGRKIASSKFTWTPVLVLIAFLGIALAAGKPQCNKRQWLKTRVQCSTYMLVWVCAMLITGPGVYDTM